MRKSMKALAITLMLIVGLAAAPALFARDSKGSDSPKMEHGMMGMMNMMGQMSEMMDTCNKMMKTAMQDSDAKSPTQQQDKKKAAE